MPADQHHPDPAQANDQTDDRSPKTDTTGHPIATGLGAIGGGVVGAAVGRVVDQKVGPAIGGVVGAIAGSMAANAAADMAGATIAEISPSVGLGLGADNRPIELPAHYSREELQALSKPDGGQLQSH